MRSVSQWSNCSHPFSTSSTIIQSGPGAELLFEFFMACLRSFMLKNTSEELVWFSSRTELISSSISFLNSKSNSFSPIFFYVKCFESLWYFLIINDVQARFSVVDGLNNVICFPAMNFVISVPELIWVLP